MFNEHVHNALKTMQYELLHQLHEEHIHVLLQPVPLLYEDDVIKI